MKIYLREGNGNSAAGKDWAQIIAIFTATLVSLTWGIFFNWPATSIPRLIAPDYPGNITLEEASYLTIFPALTVIFTSPLAARLIDLIGRRRTLLFIAIPHLISWILTGVGGSIYVFYAARIINGFADACVFATVPIYISEISTPRIRGTWGNAITFCIYFGNFVMNVVGAFCDIRTTVYIFAPIPIIFFCGFYFMPETPYYLLMKDREGEARKALKWLRQKEDVDEELAQMTADVRRQLSEPGTYKHLFTIGSNRRALLTGLFVRALQQFSGISAFSMYSQLIFEQSNSSFPSSLSAITFSGILVVANLISSFLIDYLGRRLAMIISCLGSALTLTLLTIYFYLNDNTSLNLNPFTLIPLICMLLFMFFFSIGLGIVPTVILGELFSSSIKSRALCVMNVFFGVYISASSKIFTSLMMGWGIWTAFAFFGVCCYGGAVGSFFAVPETRGKTLEEIQQQFKGHSGQGNKEIVE